MIGTQERGAMFPDDLDLVYDHFDERRWTDGLPIIPPTEARVAHMVEAARLPAPHVVAHVQPSGAAATVEKVAVNAVMAGCRPEYMLVIIAAVQAMCEPEFNLHGIQATTNPVAPLLVLNGPIRHQVRLNCGRGCLGPGWRANATIGRAVRLILINIGGALPGDVDKATHGMPGKFSFCMGELEEESPWEPLHVERGFPREASTVTVIGGQGTDNLIPIYHKAASILTIVADAMACMGHNNVLIAGKGNPVIVFPPGHARLLADQGYSKQAVKEWLFEHSKMPIDQFPPEPLTVNLESVWARDGDRVCVTKRPDDLVVLVAGGPEPYHVTYIPSFGDTAMVTKAILDKSS